MENQYKILVLSDIGKSSETMLKTSMNIAKMVEGEIDILCVKKPTDLVEKESQLSAMRTINESFIKADNKIKTIKKELSKNTQVNIKHKISFGNLKDEISNHLTETRPDIVILGKRKSNLLSFLGDNMVNFLLKKHKGTVIVTDNKNILETSSELSLGLLNDINQSADRFTKKLISQTKKPLKSFQTSNKKSVLNKMMTGNKMATFIFDKESSELKNIGVSVSKNNIDLLLVNRNQEDINFGRIVNNTGCSFLFTKE